MRGPFGKRRQKFNLQKQAKVERERERSGGGWWVVCVFIVFPLLSKSYNVNLTGFSLILFFFLPFS